MMMLLWKYVVQKAVQQIHNKLK